jgi:hypothetical protein
MPYLIWQQLFRRTRRPARRQPRPADTSRQRPDLERLETRDLLAAVLAAPTYVLIPHGGGATPFGSPGPTGYTPAQIRHAYGFDQVSYTGSGTTIAIVDAFDDPNIANDLHQFDLRFGLADPTFTRVNQSGGSTPPSADGGWASEIALDVEWAHAIAPGANILLVEANDNSFTNLLTAVRFAAAQPGVVAVSMSWGGGEFSGETSFDSSFQTPAGHAGVTFVASSGDAGAPASYPAASPNVLAVGGTTLQLDSSGNILGESAWSGSGGGLSAVEAQPAYQKGVVTQSSTQRANPDVSYDADPNTGFPVYDSFNNGTAAPWSQFGGTSDAAPQWAALIALADQGRIQAGLGSLDGPGQTLPKLYALSAADFHDITSGSSAGSPVEPAGPGYDLATGRGDPVANLVIADLVGSPGTPGATHFSVSAPSGSTAGSSFSVTVKALDGSGNVVPGYTGTVHFTSTDPSAVLPADYTFTGGDAGSHTFSVTLKTAGSQTIIVTDRSSVTGSATVAVSPAAASKLAIGQQPMTTAPGAIITPAVTVRVLDAYGNLVTGDNTARVAVALGANPGGGTLGGTTTVTVTGGVATFANLSISAAGTGYTLTASSGSLTSATSAAFNIATGGNVIEGFETSDTWFVSGFGNVSAFRSTGAAHDGSFGLVMFNGSDWIYRTDASVQLKAGDTASVWVQFSGTADGRAYFGFGASSGGTLSLVAAPNTGQLILQQNPGYGFVNLATVSQGYLPNHWYRLEVDWGRSGTIVGKLFDSNGTTLLSSVTAATTAVTSGGIAFRAIGHAKYFDTVTATYGANNFTAGGPVGPARAAVAPLFSGRDVAFIAEPPIGIGLFGEGQTRTLGGLVAGSESGHAAAVLGPRSALTTGLVSETPGASLTFSSDPGLPWHSSGEEAAAPWEDDVWGPIIGDLE